MLRKAKMIILQLSALSLFAAPLGIAGTALAQSTVQQNNTCAGSNLQFVDTAPACAGVTAAGQTKINSVITQVINVFSIAVGIVAVIMMIYGGFRYITSGGDSGAVSSAKNTILYAIVGLIIVALAQFIVKFVLDKSTR